MDESAPLATLTDASVEEVTNETYGGLKVLCEQAVEQALPGRACRRLRQSAAAGLTFRPLADTIRDTLAWKNGSELVTGLSPEQEKQLLQQWRTEGNV